MQAPGEFEYKRDSVTGLLGPFIVEYVATDSLGGTGSAQRLVYLSEDCPDGEVRCSDGSCSTSGVPSFFHNLSFPLSIHACVGQTLLRSRCWTKAGYLLPHTRALGMQ